MFNVIRIPTKFSRTINRFSQAEKAELLGLLIQIGAGNPVTPPDNIVGDTLVLIYGEWMNMEAKNGNKPKESLVQYSSGYPGDMSASDPIPPVSNAVGSTKQGDCSENGSNALSVQLSEGPGDLPAGNPEPRVEYSRVEYSRIDNNIITEQNATEVATLQDLIKKEFSLEFMKDIYKTYGVSKEDFQEECVSFVQYRREKSPRGKKERWEKEKTFDPKLRFRTWMKNNKKRSNRVIVNSDDEERKQKLAELEQKKKDLFNNF